MPVHLLLNDGSQKSYTELNLQTIKTQNVYLNTFGDEKYNKQKLDVVKLKLKGHFNGYSTEVEITAMCVHIPSICSPLPSSIDVSQFPHLKRYELADNYTDSHNYQERPIHTLIGADQYYKIVTGDIIKAEGSLTAISSIFGYLLCGAVSDELTDEMRLNSNVAIQGRFDPFS